MTTFTWLMAALSILGVWLNIKKHPICFVIWTVTNTAWMLVDFGSGLYAQAALFAAYLLLSIYGLSQWTKKDV